MAPALPDPNAPGPYKVAMAQVAPQASLMSGQLYLPSDDGTTLSSKVTAYPLLMMAPALHMAPAQLGDYAQRLASHGIVVALYQVMNEADQPAYRSVGLSLLNTLLTNGEPVVANHLDLNHVGLAGYQLGAAMSVAMASMTPTLRGLALIDPQVVGGAGNDIEVLTEMTKVQLVGSQPVLVIGEDVSNRSMNGIMPCTNPATNYLKFFEASPGPAITLDFTTAAHGEFTDEYPNPGCLGGSMDKAETKRLAIKYLTAYFQLTLLEKTPAKDYLTGPNFTSDASRYTLTKMVK